MKVSKIKFFAALVAALGLIFTGVVPANATHLRGAVGSMVYDYTAKTVTLTSTMVERKDACSTYSSSNSLCTYFAFPTISQVNRTTGAVVATVKTCTGQATTPTTSVYDNTSQPLYNIFTTTFVIDVSCPSFNTDFDYTFSQLGNNRIGGIKNSTNQTIQFEGKIRINGTTNAKAPIYNSGYMTNVPYNTSTSAVFSTNLNALEGLSGKSVTYSLITNQAAALGGYGGSKIPCSDLNLSTGEFRISAGLCVGSENYATAFSGGTPTAPIYYVLKTKATDDLGQYTTRDVLLAFASQSDNAPTLTRLTAAAGVTVVPGTPQTITYDARDADAGQTLTWSTNTLPSWATITPGSTVVDASVTPNGVKSTLTLRLNPPAGTNAALSILVSVQDSAAFPLSATNRLDVSVGSGLLPPGAPGISSVGSTGTITFTAPTGGGTVASYSAVATNLSTGATVNGTCVTSPSLSCTFSGVNNTNYSFVVTATNASGSASSSPWSPAAPILSLSPTSRSVAVGTAVTSYAITATGAPVSTYSASWSPSAPAGITFSSSTGLISGTATAAGTYTLTLTGTSASGSTGTATFTLTVTAAAQTVTWLPFGGAPMTSMDTTTTAGSNGASNLDHWVPLRAYSSVPGATITFTNVTGSYCKMQTVNGVTFGSYSWRTGKSSSSSCVYGATAAAFGNYSASSTVQQTLTINRTSSGLTDNNQKVWTAVAAQSPLLAGNVPQIASFTSPDFAASTTTLSYAVGTVLNSPLRYTLSANTYAATYCTLSPALPAGIGVTFDTRLCQLVGTVTGATSSVTYTITYKNPSGAVTYPSRTFNFGTTVSPQTVTFAQPANMVVGSTTQSISASSTSGLAITFSNDTTDKCSISGVSTTGVVTSATVTATAAGTCTIEAKQAGNSGYSAASTVTRSLTIAAALPAPVIGMAISGTEDAQRMVFEYTGNIFPLVSTGGAVARYAFLDASGTTAATIPAGLSFDPLTGILSGAAENAQARTHYIIRATNTSGTSQVDVYLTITKMSQTITFPALTSMVFADSSGTGQGLGAVADSGMPITYSIDARDIANCELIAGGKVRPKALLTGTTKTCRVWATQAGDAMMYNAATSVSQTFNIEPGLLRPDITLTQSTGRMVVGTPFQLPFEVINTGGAVPAPNAAVGSGNQFTVSGSPSVPAGLTFSNYYGTYISGSPTTMGTYVLTITATNSAGSSSATFTLTVGKQLQTVTVTTGANLTVGASDATLTSVASSGLSTFTYSIDPSTAAGVCSIVAGKLHALKYGTCIVRSDQAGDSTYEAAYGTTSVAIHQAPTLQGAPIGGSLSGTITLNVMNQQRITAGLYTLTSTGDPATSFYLKDTSGSVLDLPNSSLAGNGIDTFDSLTGYLTGIVATASGSDSVRIYMTNGYGTDPYVTVTFNYSGIAQPSLAVSGGNVIAYYGNPIPAVPYTLVNTGSDVYTCDPTNSVYSYVNFTGTLPSGVTFDRCSGYITGTPTALQSSTTYSFKGINSSGSSGTAATISLTVLPCVPAINWAQPNSIAYGTSLSSVLNPTASCNGGSNLSGTYAYTQNTGGSNSPVTGSTVLDPGTYNLGTTFTPGSSNYASGQTAQVQLVVDKCTPVITWSNPADITYGTALSSTQLNATASCNGTSVSGTFAYKAYGTDIDNTTILAAGNNLLLNVTFTPSDPTKYNVATGVSRINVLKRAAVIKPLANGKVWSGSATTDPTLTFEVTSGLLNNVDEQLKINATLSRVTGETPGTYKISITGAISDFYSISVDTSDVFFTITARTPVINVATSLTKPVGTTVVTTATANLAGVVWSIVTGTNSGLFRINSSGQISFASAATAGTYTVTIDATDGSGGNAQQMITIVVAAASGTSPILSLDLSELTLTVGTPIDASTTYLTSNLGSTVDANGYALTSGTMPGGLSFSASTGQVSGTPTTAQTQTTYKFKGSTGSNLSNEVTFKLTINKCQTAITWATPSPIVYGTALSSAQVNAVAKCGTTVIPGTMTYSDADGEPVAVGAIHKAGNNVFQAVFVPTDTANYLGSSATVTLVVTKKPIVVVLQDAQKRKGAADPVFVWDSNGVVYAGDVGALPISVTRSDLSEEIGSYVLTGSAGADDNYTITFDSTPKHLTITNNQPVVTSSHNATITAPTQTAITLTADVSVVWSIVGGADQNLFSINASTGVLSFTAPSVAGTYVVVIRATDNFGGYYEFTVTITVLAQALPEAPSGGGGSSAVKIILRTPKPITTGKPAEKTEVKVSNDNQTTQTPVPTATILNIVAKDLPTEVKNATVVEGVVVMQTQAGFTGVVEIPVQVTLESGEVQVTTTKVTVNPEAPTAVVVEEKKPAENLLTWAAASGAVEYEVTVNGVSLGTTTETSYVIPMALAADAKITVASLGRMSTASDAVPAAVKKAQSVLVLFKTVDHFAKSSSTLTAAMKKILDKAVIAIKKLGFKSLIIEGHADGQSAAPSVFSKVSVARANAVKNYIAPKLPSIKMTVRGLGKDLPVATNATPEGQAKNRRATIFGSNK
jgi:outer membrane protein OmpA-like peptidoglycan-associated protein